jgi:hypothetical protein
MQKLFSYAELPNNAKSMHLLCGSVLFALALFGFLVGPPRAAPAQATSCSGAHAKWTVLIYLNADNNLEPDAFHNFRQLSDVGSSPDVNLIVEFDRNGKHYLTKPQWARTLRFCVLKGTKPSPDQATQDMQYNLDMGDGRVLSDFVSWGMNRYPADHYMLVIWDHGQGWRQMVAAASKTLNRVAVASGKATASGHRSSPFRSASAAPFKAVSYDETSQDQLYNRKIQNSLTALLGGAKLDVIGFDACLMSMIETAYAMRNVAQFMVGSEELEPGPGWNYSLFAAQLEANPSMGARDMAIMSVDAYRSNYGPDTDGDDPNTTMSALDLSQLDQLASAVSALADSLRANLSQVKPQIIAARAQCKTYAPNPYSEHPPRDYFFHVDLACVAANLSAARIPKVSPAATKVVNAINSTVIENYVGIARQDGYGSKGIAIYFPVSGTQYKNDEFAENGYEKSNTNNPVEFVQTQHWSDFLKSYFLAVP